MEFRDRSFSPNGGTSRRSDKMTESLAPHSLGGIMRPTVRAPAAVQFLPVGEGWRGQAPCFDPQSLSRVMR